MKTLVLSLLLGISATVASADVTTIYNINFSGGSPNPTAGSFTWDSTTDQFTAFSVTFKSTVFNLSSEANSPGAVQGCGTQASTDNFINGTATDSFDLMTNPGAACGSGTSSGWEAGSISGFSFGANSLSTTCSPSIVCFIGIDDGEAGSPEASGTYTVSVVTPEPASLALFGTVVLGLAWSRRRRKT